MVDYSDPITLEINSILEQYVALDPHGIWDGEKWETYARDHASDDLLAYMEKEGEYWFECEKGELDD